jgi:hypothetical protein
MTQIDLGLTSVSRFDSADSVISVNDVNYKPWVSQPTPLKKNLGPRFDITRGSGEGFVDRGVSHRVKLVWLPSKNRVLAVSTLSCSEVLILILEMWAITYEMPGLSTIVAQTGWKVSGLGNVLLVFLDEAELLLLFLS